MAQDSSSGAGRRRRRRLTPQEKYQVFLEVVTDQVGSQREAADKWRVDRSTVTRIMKQAREGALARLAASKPGRPGKSPEQAALEEAEAEIARLRDTITEQAIELHLFRGKDAWG